MEIKYKFNQDEIKAAIILYLKTVKSIDVSDVSFIIQDDYDHADRRTGGHIVSAEATQRLE